MASSGAFGAIGHGGHAALGRSSSWATLPSDVRSTCTAPVDVATAMSTESGDDVDAGGLADGVPVDGLRTSSARRTSRRRMVP